MTRKVLFTLCSFMIVSTGWIMAQGDNAKRVALVIGVRDYQYVSPLQNTLNDARDMSTALKSRAFEVVELYNPSTKRQMQDAIIRYFQLLQANPNSVGMVYYSGHGMQVDGSNYLIPTQANPQIKADLDDQCLNMDYVMRAIEQAGNPLNIFVLDACRNNPFKGFYRSAEQGLNMVATPKGSYIVYATKPGSVASDGTGRNGLFTSKLLKHLSAPGLNIEQVFKKVAADVASESADAQRPWIASDYSGDFFFYPGEAAAIPVSSPGPAVVFTDNFAGNENKWLSRETDDYFIGVIDGKYRLSSKRGGSWFSTIPVQLNTNRDFDISFTTTKVSGTDGYFYGIVLGYDVATTYFHLAGITGWGNAVLANKGPAPKDIIPVKVYEPVIKGNAVNQVLLKKTNNEFRLFVNGQFIGASPSEEFFGNYFGFRIWSGNEALTIDFDNLVIRSY